MASPPIRPLTFAHKDAEAINKKLQAARIAVTVTPYYMRIAASIYNDLHDVDRLLEALARGSVSAHKYDLPHAALLRHCVRLRCIAKREPAADRQ